MNERYAKGQSFTRAGLGNAYHVRALERHGDYLVLNWSGINEAQRIQTRQEIAGDAKFGKSGRGFKSFLFCLSVHDNSIQQSG